MKILTIDIGTGTQDIYLYDSRVHLENGFKLILPSPTMIVRRQIQYATQNGDPLLLTGVTMGGGPSHWAAEDHLKAGFPVFATPQAARSFNDDLDVVTEMGIQVLSENEAKNLPDSTTRLELKDLDLDSIASTFSRFGVSLDDLDGLAVAVFDHGNAPPDVSDRQFRFDYLNERIQENNHLSTFAFLSDDVPNIMTRMQAVVTSATRFNRGFGTEVPLLLMDTAPAAILGALHDQAVPDVSRLLAANVGNFHTLAFLMEDTCIQGVFEHHTGMLDRNKLEELLKALAGGTLTHTQVFNDHGHGALVYPAAMHKDEGTLGESLPVVVTGPRRSLMHNSGFQPFYAAPFGDMMITGCFGLLSATAELVPEFSESINQSLTGNPGLAIPPWEVR